MDLNTYYYKLENLHYRNFLISFVDTTYYNRLKLISDLNIQRLLDSFISQTDSGEENINKSIFEQKFSVLFFASAATDQEKQEIQDLLNATNLDASIKIPDSDYLSNYYYNSEYDYIVPNVQPPSPYPSWSYDIHTNRHWPPVSKPELTESDILNQMEYKWDENSLNWILQKV